MVGSKNSLIRSISSLIFGLILGLVLGLLLAPEEGLFVGLIGWLIVGLIAALAMGLSIRSNLSIKNGIFSWLIYSLIWGLIFWLRTVQFSGVFVFAVLLFAVMCGLFTSVGIGTLNSIKTIETVSWSWKSSFKIFARVSLIAGLIIMGVIIGMKMEVDGVKAGLFIGLTFGSFFGLIDGIIGGFTDKIREDKAFPNQGIRLSFKNGLIVGFIAVFIVGLIYGLIFLISPGSEDEIDGDSSLTGLLFLWLFPAMIAGLNRGLGAVIKHYALRLVL